MRSTRFYGLFGWVFFLMSFLQVIEAEDWTTLDGKVYLQVTIVKAEPDAVTILYRDGGALIPLTNLPDDLQTQFHYDPVKAAAAAEERARADAASAAALQAESARLKQLQAEMLAKQKAAEKAEKRRELLERIGSYNNEPAVLEPQNHSIDILGKPK